MILVTGAGDNVGEPMLDELAAAAVALTTHGHVGKAYTLTGPESFSYRDAAATITAVTGSPVSVVQIAEAEARAGMAAGGIPDFYAEYLIDLDRWYTEGHADLVTSSVRDITGRDATSFEQFVRDYASAFTA